MNATLNGTNLVLTIPLKTQPSLSKSGKALVIASTAGWFATGLTLQGREICISANAVIKSKAPVAAA